MNFLREIYRDKFFSYRVWIGVKALLDLIEVARQAEDSSRVARFLGQLEDVAGML